jgi:hypothetical protein
VITKLPSNLGFDGVGGNIGGVYDVFLQARPPD